MARGLGHLVWLATRLLVPAAAEEPPPAADAIVVLGAPLRADGGCTTTLEERVGMAARLYSAGLAPLVLLSGGISLRPATRRPEAEGMAVEAIRRGIPKEALVLERESRTTAENAGYSALLLAERGARRALLVTHAYHLRRATRLFAAVGVEPLPVLLRESFLYDGAEGSRVGLRLLAREVGVGLIRPFRR